MYCLKKICFIQYAVMFFLQNTVVFMFLLVHIFTHEGFISASDEANSARPSTRHFLETAGGGARTPHGLCSRTSMCTVIVVS